MHPDYDVILFDFDGTVCETGEGVMNSVRYALQKMGLPEAEEKILRSFVGPPPAQNFREKIGMTEEEAEQAVAFFRERYAKKGIYEVSFYDGVVPLVLSLKKAGFKVALASSKAECFICRMLEYLGQGDLFHIVTGATLDGTRSTKAEVLDCALKRCKVEKSRTVLIGDTKYDVIGALQKEIPFVGVLWGYGTEQEMRSFGAKRFVKNPEELRALLLPEAVK